MANAATLQIAREVRQTLAGSALTERQAKLYSQRLRREMGQEGLATFAPSDVDVYLDEAILLIQCGLLERKADPGSGWREGIKRGAEILEWLSQPSLKPADAPLHLLAAAAYQLADYPAMALGHLRRVPTDQSFSVLLREFLRANFPATLQTIHDFWWIHRVNGIADRISPEDLTSHTYQHAVMSIGTVCAYFRTGRDRMTERAITKLEKLAASLLHSRDPYSYLLALLTAASCRRFVETCLWRHIERLREVSSTSASAALAQFARSAFINRRSLVWPAQAVGIERLRENSSFVLCTPTGSGKTTVATLAIVQNLFSDPPGNPSASEDFTGANLVLYLVPSRALAAEVEHRLAQDLTGIAAEPIVVTGLYGGIDWGPTDAWIDGNQPTIVICTFEKADALLRYLGVLFLSRVRLIVVDEAHMVEQDQVRHEGLQDGSSRALRLEQLGARLLRARNDNNFRVIALSAVAAGAAPALARWVSGLPEASPMTSSYRSTRQMLGRLEVSTAGRYSIHYDLMDGRSLRFQDENRTDRPFVHNPFAPLPGGIPPGQGPEVSMRAPTLWAALQLAAVRPDGSMPSVLISLTQGVEVFSATCADLIESWPANILPDYWSVDNADPLWNRCLASAADYFTDQSVEYRLLRRGIAVHHGKMPGLLARRLKTVIDRGYIRVIIATSTLSEGVNIPVNFLLIPSVYRGPSVLSLQEFTNLSGRAGRPGVATEGSALIVLPERTMARSRQWDGYSLLVNRIEATSTALGESTPQDSASSPLAALLQALEVAWRTLTGGGTDEDFTIWLEHTAVVGADNDSVGAHDYLDSLDAFLIAALQEVEELRQRELSADEVETELTTVWRCTYAFSASQEEARLARIWLARGRVIKFNYPDSGQRRRIYKTSLSPRSAASLFDLAEAIRTRLQTGADYGLWLPEERFAFLRDVLSIVSQVPAFRFTTTLGRHRNFHDWPTLLRWWLAKASLRSQPAPKEISNWYDFVAQNFIYRSAWGLGSLIGLLLEREENEQPIRALEIGDWPESGLPWIAFWIKELITWGTLEPVAAFLLARGDAIDRPQAEADARSYYDQLPNDVDANNALDPRRVRDWVEGQRVRSAEPTAVQEIRIEVTLIRPASNYLQPLLTVAPLEAGDHLVWVDPAGYTVARSEKPSNWPGQSSTFEFELSIPEAIVAGNAYLRHI